MEHVYSHHHVAHAHHSGLIIGTLVGSCLVTLFLTIAMVVINPQLVLHPLSFSTQVTLQKTETNNTVGPMAQQATNLAPETHSVAGPVATGLQR